MESRPSKFFDICVNHAIANPGVGRAKIAAIVAIGNKIVSIGQNSRRTHPFAKRYQKICGAECLHAEIDAIVRALRVVDAKELSKASIYVARVKHPNSHDSGWVTGLAKPCAGCLSAIDKYKLKTVLWTNDGFKLTNKDQLNGYGYSFSIRQDA